MQFTEIPGLAETKRSLMQAIDRGQVAHAQLFLGPPGSANLAMALAYATYLNCEDRRPNGSCGSGTTKNAMQKYVHPDFHFVFPVSSTKEITGKDVVSDSYLPAWREFITQNPYGDITDWSAAFGGENKQPNISKEESRNIIRKLSLTAFEDQYKVVLIWLPEYLHPSAANGILKILEEPPAKTVFLLVAYDAEKLLSTILSRTQIVHIRAFSEEELAAVLEREKAPQTEAQRERIQQVALMAGGNIRRALQLYDQAAGDRPEEDSHALFQEWMRQCYAHDYTALVAFTERFQKLGKEGQKSLLHYGLNMMREVLMMLAADSPALDESENRLTQEKRLIRLQGKALSFVVNFTKVMNFEKVEQLTQLFNEGYYHLERNANPKILFLDTSLTLARIIKS